MLLLFINKKEIKIFSNKYFDTILIIDILNFMINVGVIRGGSDNSYDSSILSGGFIISSLLRNELNSNYKPIDIFIDRDGVWHMNGMPTNPEKIKEKVDVIFNSLHGDYVQSGEIQKLFEYFEIPYTGNDSSTSSFVNDKSKVKEELSKIGINIPTHILYSAYLEDLDGPHDKYIKNITRDVYNRLPPPWAVKPLTNSSSMPTFICKTVQELMNAFVVGIQNNVSILVEEMIEGRSVYMDVISNFRNKKIYPLLCDGSFSSSEKREIENMATLIHNKLNLKHYSQSHFIVHPKKGIYAIGVNLFPELHENSLFSKHLIDVGSSPYNFIDHIIKLIK